MQAKLAGPQTQKVLMNVTSSIWQPVTSSILQRLALFNVFMNKLEHVRGCILSKLASFPKLVAYAGGKGCQSKGLWQAGEMGC